MKELSVQRELAFRNQQKLLNYSKVQDEYVNVLYFDVETDEIDEKLSCKLNEKLDKMKLQYEQVINQAYIQIELLKRKLQKYVDLPENL